MHLYFTPNIPEEYRPSNLSRVRISDRGFLICYRPAETQTMPVKLPRLIDACLSGLPTAPHSDL